MSLHQPEGDYHIVIPVRDTSRETPHEDLERDPDGVPHSVVGATAGFAAVLAILVAAMFLLGHGVMRYAGIGLVILAIPFLVNGLSRKAEHDRNHVHPSR